MVENIPGVRLIPMSGWSMTGQAIGTPYESSLERDFLALVMFDEDVTGLQAQPLKIRFVDAQGKTRSYIPDVRIIFRTKPCLLCEVKYRRELDKGKVSLEERLAAGRAYCEPLGWSFDVFDEHRIRTPRLKNINFLWRHYVSERNPTSPFEHAILAAFAARGDAPATQASILNGLYSDVMQRGRAIWVWWHMVAHKKLGCDLDEPLSEATEYWPAAVN